MLSNKITEIKTLYQQYNNINGTIELEAKFGYNDYKGFNSTVPYVHYERLLNNLRDRIGNETIEESTVASADGIRRITIINPGNNPEKVIWQTKQLVRNYTFDDYGIRVSLNLEEDLPDDKIPTNFTPKILRERTRTSFVMKNGLIRVDLTDVLMRKTDGNFMHKYEVEVEFIGSADQINIFEESVVEIFKILRGTRIVYTETVKNAMIETTIKTLGGTRNNMIDKSVLVEARNIKRRDLVYGGIVGNRETAYMITYKADGLRKMLIIHATGIWLVYPPHEFNLVLDSNINIANLAQILRQFSGTVFDGELIDLKDPTNVEYTYLAFDCLSLRGDNKIQIRPYVERKQLTTAIAAAIKTNILTIDTKRTELLSTPERFFELVTDFLNGRDKLPYLEDGLMFFPADSEYNPHSEQYPLYQRSLTKYPDTCKWKESLDITIDFSLKWTETGKLELYSYDEDIKDLAPFTGTVINPFTNDMIDHTHELTKGRPSGTVVEYEFRKDIRKLVPRRIRFDKHGPNKLNIAKDNWDDIMKPISRADIEGRTLMMTTSYHNRIKRNQYNSIPKGANILDIGSGFGGDVDKWKNQLGLVVAVEPNNINSTELISRLKTFDMTERVKVVHTGGEDTVAITEAVRSFIPGEKVDAVTLMLSMSFFWSSEEHLQALVNTIVTNLKPGGSIVFLTANGDTIEQMFEPALGGEYITDLTLVSSEFHLHPKPNNIKFGRTLDINIPDSIVGKQREYLVRLQDFTLRLEKYGIYLEDLRRAEEEKLLSSDNAKFSSMFSYGRYINHDKSLLENAIIPITNIKLPEIEMETPQVVPSNNLLPTVPIIPISIPPPTSTPLPIALPSSVYNNEELPWLQVSLQGTNGRLLNKPGFGDDTYAPLKCTWHDNLVRIATIGDGSCFIHAVMKAYDREYQENNSGLYRSNAAAQMRRDIALMLSYSNPEYPEHTFWASSALGAFPSILMQQIMNESLVGELGIDYTIAGLQRLFNSNSYLGDEVYSFVSDALGVDIYVLRATRNDLFPHLHTRKPGINRNAIVIIGNTYHYEVLAIDDGKYFQTVFPPNDPFIDVLTKVFIGNKLVDWNSQQNFNPDEHFIQTAVSTFAQPIPNSDPPRFELNIPQLVNEIFQPNDPFKLLLDRLMPNIQQAVENMNDMYNPQQIVVPYTEVLENKLDNLLNQLANLDYSIDDIQLIRDTIINRIDPNTQTSLIDVVSSLLEDGLINQADYDTIIQLVR